MSLRSLQSKLCRRVDASREFVVGRGSCLCAIRAATTEAAAQAAFDEWKARSASPVATTNEHFPVQANPVVDDAGRASCLDSGDGEKAMEPLGKRRIATLSPNDPEVVAALAPYLVRLHGGGAVIRCRLGGTFDSEICEVTVSDDDFRQVRCKGWHIAKDKVSHVRYRLKISTVAKGGERFLAYIAQAIC